MAAFSRMTAGHWARLGLSLAAFLSCAWSRERNVVWRDEVAVWEDTLSKAPRKARVQGNLGVAYFIRGRIYQELMKRDPDPDRVREYEQRREADWDRSERHFREAVAIDSRFTEIWANMGNMFHARRRMDEAEAALDRAIKYNPNRGEFHSNLGGVYLEKGWITEAIIEFEHAARLSPHPSRAYSNLGVALSAMKKYREAVGALKRAVELEPGYIEARVNLGLAYENAGQVSEAEQTFEEVCTAVPGHVGAILNLAHLKWSKRGDAAAALSLVQRAIGLMHPGDPRAGEARELERRIREEEKEE